jgi:hypothetical protein
MFNPWYHYSILHLCDFFYLDNAVCVELYSIWPFKKVKFFLFTIILLKFFQVVCISGSFFFEINIPWHEYTTLCLIIHLLILSWTVFFLRWGILQIKLLWVSTHRFRVDMIFHFFKIKPRSTISELYDKCVSTVLFPRNCQCLPNRL